MTTITLPAAQRQTFKWWQPVWNYIRPELLPLFRALTEIALITPLAIRFMPWAALWSPAVLGLWLLMLMLVPLYLDRVLSLLRVPTGRRRILLLIGALAASVINVRLLLYGSPGIFNLSWLSELYSRLIVPGNRAILQDVSVVVFTALAWWRGITLSGRGADSQRTGRYFRLSIILVLPAIFLISGNSLRNEVTPFVLLYFVGMLTTMALTRAQQVESGESGAAFPVTPGWLMRVLGPSVGLAFITGLFTALLTGQPVAGLLGWLSPLWLAVSATANTVMALLFRVAAPIFDFIDWFFAFLQQLYNSLPRVTPTPLATPDNGAIRPTPTPNPEIVPVFDQAMVETFVQVAGIVLVVVALAVLIYLSLRSSRQLAAGRDVITGRREKTDGDQGGPTRPGGSLLDNLRQWRRLRTAASIRRIYENTLIIAAQNGFPRAAVETPIEFVPTLDRVWPEQHAEIDLITQAYVRVRYGEVPETAAEFEAIRHAWDVLRQTPPRRRDEDKPTDETA